jgi:hypothetical protein
MHGFGGLAVSQKHDLRVRTALIGGPSGPRLSARLGSQAGSMVATFARRARVWLGRRAALLLLVATVSGLAAGGLARSLRWREGT